MPKNSAAQEKKVNQFWFDTWEQFVVEYGFATIGPNGEVIFDEKMKARIGKST